MRSKIVLLASLFFLACSGACAGHRYPAVRSAQPAVIVEQHAVVPSTAAGTLAESRIQKFSEHDAASVQDHSVAGASVNAAGTRAAPLVSVVWSDGTKPVPRNRVRPDRYRDPRTKNVPIVPVKKSDGKRLAAVRMDKQKDGYRVASPHRFNETADTEIVSRGVPEKPQERLENADLLAVLNSSPPATPSVSGSEAVPPPVSLVKDLAQLQETKNAPLPSLDTSQGLFVPLKVGNSFSHWLRISLPVIAFMVLVGLFAGYILSRRLRRTTSFDNKDASADTAHVLTPPLAPAHSAPDAVPITGQGEKVPARSDTGDNNASGETVSLN